MKLFRKPPQTQYIALDIGTGVAKALQYEFEAETGNLYVKGIGQNQHREGNLEYGSITNTQEVAQTLYHTIVESNHLESSTDQALIIGSSGIYNENRTFQMSHIRSNKTKKITPKEFQEIFSIISSRLDTEHAIIMKTLRQSMVLAQSSIKEVKIDDMQVSQPIGMVGSKVDLTIHNTYVPEEFLHQITQISQEINIPVAGIFSETYATTKLLLDSFQGESLSMILVDVGTWNTNVAVIQKNELMYSNAYSIGGYHFTRQLADQARLSKKISMQIADVIKEDIRYWCSGLTLSLEEAFQKKKDSLPGHIVLYGGGAGLIGLKESLEFGNWYQDLTFISKPLVSIFQPKSLPTIIDNTNKLNTPEHINVLGLANIGARLKVENLLYDSKFNTL
jgi:cell division ATPase FtsA